MYSKWTSDVQRNEMTRKKREDVRRMPIDLDLNDPAQASLWEHWEKLSERGEASRWVRDTLIASLPAVPKSNKLPAQNGRSEPHYEDVDE